MSDQGKTKRQLIAELAALRQRHADLEKSLRTTPSPLMITRLSDGLILEANESMANLMAYSRDELIGQTILHLDAHAEPSDCRRLMARLQEQGEVRDVELRLRRRTGEVRQILVSASQVEMSSGPCILTSMLDITPFKRLESALRESEEKYRNLVERASDGICIIQDMAMRYLNPRLAEMWDGTAEEVIGRPFADFIHPDARLTLIDRYRRRMAGEVVSPTYETVLRRKDGSALHVELNVGLIAYQDRPAELVIVRDITEHKLAEAERERLRAKLLQSQKMEAIGQMAAGIAHDFNNLLTAILGFSELLQLNLAPEDPLQEMVSHIRNSGQRAAMLVSQLLGLGRKQMIVPRVSNLNDVVARATAGMRHELNAAIELAVLPAPDLWPVEVDPEQFARLIRDLALNARRAMPGGGRLTIETANVTFGAQEVRVRPEVQPGDYVLLAVHDTGAGMSQEAAARVFEPFFIASREVADGTGLRMAAVYGIVKQNRGYIFAESREGAGTTFNVYLPRCEQRLGGPQAAGD